MKSTNHHDCYPVRTEGAINTIPSTEWNTKSDPEIRYPNILPRTRTGLENIRQTINNEVDKLLEKGIYPLASKILRVFK